MAKQRYGNELHPLYSRWLSMTQRCTNPNHKQYKDWGERGITICEEFKDFHKYCLYVESLEGFNLKIKQTIDRIDNNKGYEIGNLRWTDYSIQLINQRKRENALHSKYVGITWNKYHNRWVARVTYKGKRLYSMTFKT